MKREQRSDEIRNMRIPQEVFDDVQRGIDLGYWIDHQHWWSFYIDRAVRENVWPDWLIKTLTESTLVEEADTGDDWS